MFTQTSKIAFDYSILHSFQTIFNNIVFSTLLLIRILFLLQIFVFKLKLKYYDYNVFTQTAVFLLLHLICRYRIDVTAHCDPQHDTVLCEIETEQCDS